MDGRMEREQKSRNKMNRIFEEQRINNIIRNYYRDRLCSGMSFKSCEDYTKYVIRFTSYVERKGKYNYAEIKKIDINDFISSLSYDSKGRPKKISDSYEATVWSALKNFFDYLSDEDVDLITRNPMNNMKRPKVKDVCKQVYLTADEIQIIINGIRKNEKQHIALRDELIFRVFIISGARLSAVSDLNISDCAKGEMKFIDKGEVKSSCPLDCETQKLLNSWLSVRNNIINKKRTETKALFVNNSGERVSTRTIERLVEKYTLFIPKKITPHKLRVTYATHIYLETKDPLYTQKRMHHASFSTTQRYLAGIEEDNKKAVGIMSKLL